MDKKQLKLVIALIWIVSILVFVAALTALAKTVSASPADSIHRRALTLIEGKTVPEAKERKYVELSADKEALKQRLTEEQYNVCFNAATELPFSGKYWDNHEPGTYHCVVCETPLFSSTTKFDSGTGWPSFYDAVDEGAIELREDGSHGMKRTETLCANCGAHLGHIFNDGPPPTGMRYCINSAALDFRGE